MYLLYEMYQRSGLPCWGYCRILSCQTGEENFYQSVGYRNSCCHVRRHRCFDASGVWNVESSKKPVLIKTGAFVGQPSPSDIRGSYTWEDISKAFGIPTKLLTEAFGASSSADKINMLEALYLGKVPEGQEIGTDSVRLFVSLYTGIPHTPEAGTLLPSTAIMVLRREGKGASGAFEEAAGKAINMGDLNPPSGQTSTPSSFTPIAFTGKTTFKDLLDAGYLLEDIEAEVGKPKNLNMAIKDYASGLGIEFSELKAKLSALVPIK